MKLLQANYPPFKLIANENIMNQFFGGINDLGAQKFAESFTKVAFESALFDGYRGFYKMLRGLECELNDLQEYGKLGFEFALPFSSGLALHVYVSTSCYYNTFNIDLVGDDDFQSIIAPVNKMMEEYMNALKNMSIEELAPLKTRVPKFDWDSILVKLSSSAPSSPELFDLTNPSALKEARGIPVTSSSFTTSGEQAGFPQQSANPSQPHEQRSSILPRLLGMLLGIIVSISIIVGIAALMYKTKMNRSEQHRKLEPQKGENRR